MHTEGFKVHAVLNCDHDFLSMIHNLRPHVIMLDYRLKGEDCIRICQEIKAVYPHLPVLAISCNNNINDVYSKFGFDGYITKPFDLDNLYIILRKHIPKQKANNEANTVME